MINPYGDDDEDFELNFLIDRHMKVMRLLFCRESDRMLTFLRIEALDLSISIIKCLEPPVWLIISFHVDILIPVFN